MTDDLLRWVAEELLGWDFLKERIPDAVYYDFALDRPKPYETFLCSWFGIGLVVEAMKKQPTEVRDEFYNRLEAGGDWWFRQDVSEFIFYHARGAVLREAARKAVGGK